MTSKKSRAGCITCKRRRCKCDETKPFCKECEKRGVKCEGYATNFKWKSFKGMPKDAAPNEKPHKDDFVYHGRTPEAPVLKDADFEPQKYLSPGPQPSIPYNNYTTTSSTLITQPYEPEKPSRKRRQGGADNTEASSSKRRIVDEIITELPPHEMQLSFSPTAVTQIVPHNGTYHTQSQVPLPMDDYYTHIWRLFDHHTCGIVTIKDGPSDNPWRTSIWPLAQRNSVLYHAIAAMTLFHTARGNIDIRREAFNHMRESIQHLACGISTLQPDVALATTLSLAFAESWDQHITAGMLHLRGSKPLVKELLAKYNRRLPSWLLFLYNSYVYLDVLARFTSSDADNDDVIEIGTVTSDSPVLSEAAGVSLQISPAMAADLMPLQQRIVTDVFPLPQPTPLVQPMNCASDGIDPLLGCAQTLFPVIGKIAIFVNRISKGHYEGAFAQAAVLMQLLQQWRPATALQYFVNDPDWDIKSCVNTAEAYRYAAMIHLVQAVPDVQIEPLEVTTKRVLRYLEEIPTTSRTCTTHIFPLFVAGCEARGEQRNFVLQRWDALAIRLWIGNVDRTIEVMEEVWRQRDRMGWTGGPVGVTSPAYWSQVMKNWKWEVLLG